MAKRLSDVTPILKFGTEVKGDIGGSGTTGSPTFVELYDVGGTPYYLFKGTSGFRIHTAVPTAAGDGTLIEAVGAGSILLAGLATGIAPSHVVKYAGTITWSGSGTALATTVTGVLSTDIVVSSFLVTPTQAAYVTKIVPTTNTITITLSAANTSNDAQVSYVVYRAAA